MSCDDNLGAKFLSFPVSSDNAQSKYIVKSLVFLFLTVKDLVSADFLLREKMLFGRWEDENQFSSFVFATFVALPIWYFCFISA